MQAPGGLTDRPGASHHYGAGFTEGDLTHGASSAIADCCHFHPGACSARLQQSRRTPPATPTPAPAPTPTPTRTACTNPLFPVVNGAKWTYSLSGISSGTFTHSIIAVRPDGFTDQDVFNSGVTRTGEWKCEDGALSALNPAESLSAMIQWEDFTADYKTTSATV